MKKLLLILSLFALLLSCAKDEGMGVENQPLPEEFTYKVSVDQALKNLDIALANIDGETRSAKRSVKSIERVKASQVMDLTRSADIPQLEDLLYVVSFGEGQGSAVLGADKRVSPVLAIFDETVFEAEDFNRPETRSEIADEGEVRDVETEEELEEFVAGMITAGAVSELSSRAGGDFEYLPITPITLTRRDTVVTTLYERTPMLNTKWGQGSPYNNSCPIDSDTGIRSVAGCDPIAMAQFLNYHKFTNTNVISGVTYDWNLISGNRYGRTPTNAEINELADFIHAIGVSGGAQYSSNNTGVVANYLSIFLTNRGISSSYTEWTGVNEYILRDYVIYDGPICARGEKEDNSGHAWVIDGWNEYKTEIKDIYYQAITGTILREEVLSSVTTQLMHFNMGWSGVCDGYYNGNTLGFNASVPLDPENVNTNIGDIIGINPGCYYIKDFHFTTY